MPHIKFVRIVALVFAMIGVMACQKNETSDAPVAKAEASVSASPVKPIDSTLPPAESASAAPSASAAVAAASAAAPPPEVPLELTAKSTEEDIAAVGKRMIAMLEDSATMLTASEGDCVKIVAGYDKVLVEHATAVLEIKSMASNRPIKKRVERWLEGNSGDLKKRVSKAGEFAKKCAKDKDFKAASTRFRDALRGR